MTFTAINLDRLPAPQIIDQPSFEVIFANRKARLLELVEVHDADLAVEMAKTLELESEPVVKLLQEDSYREVMFRAATQDAAKGNLLAFAEGAMLDHLAAYWGIQRQIIQEADPQASPPILEEKESDKRLRRRVQLAPEAITTAGSIGSYVFWALAASPLVKDVDVTSPDEGEVLLTVLSTQGNGRPDQELLNQVFLTVDPRRDFTAKLMVAPATINQYVVVAELTLFDGPDAELVRQASLDGLEAYVTDHHALGHDITISGLHAALHTEGVQNVNLISPAADLVVEDGFAPFCTSKSVTVEGRDE